MRRSSGGGGGSSSSSLSLSLPFYLSSYLDYLAI